MVQSNINKKVNYTEKRDIDYEDKQHQSMPYTMELFDKEVVILFGKPNYTHINDNIGYCSIYLVVNKKIYSKIGVYEFPLKEKKNRIIDDDEINIDEMNDDELLLFTFVDERFIDNAGSTDSMFKENSPETNRHALDELNKKGSPEIVEIEVNDLIDETDEDEAVKVRIKSADASSVIRTNNQLLKEGVFKVDESIKLPKPLVEETEENDKENRSNYKKHDSFRDNWIQKFLRNKHYGIHDVENNGDCFFAVLRDAFSQIGYITTVKKLRAIVSKEVTQNVYQQQRNLYNMLNDIKDGYEKEKKEIKENNAKLKEREKMVKKDKDAAAKLLEQTKELKKRYDELNELINEQNNLMAENVSDFSKIHSLEEYREYIMSPKYWADSWAISVIERELQVKMIILSERAYLEKDYDGVLMCGEASPDLQKKGIFQPKHYIMTMFSGNHFKLVCYKNRRILTFSEIPYRIKGLIINRCMESKHGIYSLIPDFQDAQDKMGILRENNQEKASQESKHYSLEENIQDEDEKDHVQENSSFYDKSTVFVFHRNSSHKQPGQGVHEKIKKDQIGLYIPLSTKPFKHWRRKLDDSWNESPFEVEGKKYASIEHYYQGAKFKQNNQDFQSLFSLESNSPFSKDVDLAICAGSKTGKPTKKCKEKMKGEDLLLRPDTVKIDPDFYDKRANEERMKALRAKFTQNVDLKKVLLATKDAELKHFERGNPLQNDGLLMAVREYIHREEK